MRRKNRMQSNELQDDVNVLETANTAPSAATIAANSPKRKRGRKPQAVTASAEFRRINVSIPHWMAEILEDIAQKRGTTITDVVRGAIDIEAWIEESLENGGDVLKQNDDMSVEKAPLGERRRRFPQGRQPRTPLPAS